MCVCACLCAFSYFIDVLEWWSYFILRKSFAPSLATTQTLLQWTIERKMTKKKKKKKTRTNMRNWRSKICWLSKNVRHFTHSNEIKRSKQTRKRWRKKKSILFKTIADIIFLLFVLLLFKLYSCHWILAMQKHDRSQRNMLTTEWEKEYKK